MRFWQRIFLMAMATVTVALCVLGYLIIAGSHRSNLEREMERGIREHHMLALNLQTSLIYKRFDLSASYLEPQQVVEVLRGVTDGLSPRRNPADQNGVLVELYRQGQLIYTNFPLQLGDDRPELTVPERSCTALLRPVDGHVYLFTVSTEWMEDSDYLFVSIRPVDTIFQTRSEMIGRFARVSTAISGVVAVVLLLTAYFMTRRVRQLQVASNCFAQGDYEVRNPVRGHDEISELSQDFNAMAQAVQTNVQELETVAEDRKRFIDNLAHEMKTPLTSIIGFADLLRSARTVDDDTRLDYADAIYTEGQHLKSLSSKLMELILLGRTVPEVSQVELPHYLESIVALLQPMATSRGVVLAYRCPSLTVCLDEELIKSLLFNLIDNATKASQPGQAVELSGGRDEAGRVQIQVCDHGCGMPPSEVRKVVQPFYMLDKARTRAAGGAGLGLALCLEIARVHHATLDIQSQEGQGTTITLTFGKEAAA